MESQGESGGSGGHAGGVVGGVGVAPSNHIYGPASVHLLPCKIHHNGPAPVATYFRPADSRHKGSVEQLGKTDAGGNQERECCDGSTEQEQVKGALGILGADRRKDGQVWEHFEDDGEEHTARFRGRKLVGRKMVLPDGVYGVVLREKPWPEGVREENEELSSFWAAETSFRDVTVWGHDEIRQESTVDRCLAWMEVANSIHDP